MTKTREEELKEKISNLEKKEKRCFNDNTLLWSYMNERMKYEAELKGRQEKEQECYKKELKLMYKLKDELIIIGDKIEMGMEDAQITVLNRINELKQKITNHSQQRVLGSGSPQHKDDLVHSQKHKVKVVNPYNADAHQGKEIKK